MRAIQSGNVFNLYDDSIKTYDQLPARVYRIAFNKQTGFMLVGASPITVAEKVYGVHDAKVAKVMRSFADAKRNLGIILSGDKGIGKSLFAKLLCNQGIASGYPVIIVDTYIPDIANFINTIEQESIVLFDEFDKTFDRRGSDEINPQAEMLTLFDGLSVGKKMFVVTCNDLRGLNDYLVNRPGRFHYHFRFDYPNADSIREYLKDKIATQYYDQIEPVVGFSKRVPLNYDCLRAIAFELNYGLSFKEAIADLNIINTSDERYTAVLYFEDGTKLRTSVWLDTFSDEEIEIEIGDKKEDELFDVAFIPADAHWNSDVGNIIIRGDQMVVKPCDWIETNGNDDIKRKVKGKKAAYMTLSRVSAKNIHYAV